MSHPADETDDLVVDVNDSGVAWNTKLLGTIGPLWTARLIVVGGTARSAVTAASAIPTPTRATTPGTARSTAATGRMTNEVFREFQ
jgi:hypothetical protein